MMVNSEFKINSSLWIIGSIFYFQLSNDALEVFIGLAMLCIGVWIRVKEGED